MRSASAGPADEDAGLGHPVVDQLGRPIADVPGRPVVDVSLVPDEVADLPVGAADDAGPQAGPLGRVGQQRAVAVERVDMGGDLHAAHRATRPGAGDSAATARRR